MRSATLHLIEGGATAATRRKDAASANRVLRREGVTLFRRPYDLLKRAFDLSFCLFLLPFSLLVMGVCAALIWITDGRPLLFAQDRTGRGGRRFRLYKFRTMVRNAAELKEQLAELNQLSGPDFKIEDDPRITPLGRIMRKTSLDELPQIFNVLLGDMSLVGPRPTSFEASTYDLWHTERLEVLPGITGLWQVGGRSDVDFDERVRLDIEYVEKRSLLLDTWILVRTVGVLFSQRGAY
jgi:lipopolysaccharide/colanic/teichoic acid biosynthesis glycosyltransferase